MRVRIHRGAHEIGGNCVEVEAEGKRIVLDVGRPLEAGPCSQPQLPPIQGLESGDDGSLLGVLISHPHLDHWGLLPRVHPDVPAFIGEAAHRILSEAAFYSPFGYQRNPAGFLKDRRAVDLGPFRITPFLADHSAYDAYSLLVEADGQRVFYTGDLRAHGAKAPLFERLVREPPADIDVLLMEGTHVLPDGADARPKVTEEDVERECIRTFKQTEGIVLVAFSAQNIDRLVKVFNATLQADRDLVVDLYADAVARATGNPKIPAAGRDRLHVLVPHRQKLKVKLAGEYHRTRRVRPYRLFPEQLKSRRSRLVVLFRDSMIGDMERADCLEGATLVWSLWPGYLDLEPSGPQIRNFCKRHRVPLVVHHASGHAHVEDLQRLVQAVDPARVVPIHSFGSDRYPSLFPRVDIQPDGAWWEVATTGAGSN